MLHIFCTILFLYHGEPFFYLFLNIHVALALYCFNSKILLEEIYRFFFCYSVVLTYFIRMSFLGNSITRSFQRYTNIHSEDSNIWIIFYTWYVYMFFNSNRKVPIIINRTSFKRI